MFLVLAGLFLPYQSIWIDETTQLSGLTLPPAEAAAWLAGRDPHRFGVPPDRMPPLGYWLGWMWSKVFGLTETSMRWFGAVAVAMAVFVTSAVALRAFGRVAALVTGLLLALSANVIIFGVEIRAYPLLILFAACAFASLVRFSLAPPEREGRWLIALAASCLAAVYTHFFGAVLTGAVLCGALFVALLRRRGVGRTLLAGAATAVCSLGIIPFVLFALERTKDAAAAGAPEPIREQLARFLYRLCAHASMALSLPVVALAAASFGALAIAALAPRVRGGRAAAGLVTALLAGGAAVLLGAFIMRSVPILAPSYNLWMAPGIALLLGSALAARGRLAPRVATIAAGILLAANLYGAVQLIRHGSAFSHGPGDRLIQLVGQHGPDRTLVVHEAGSSWAHAWFPLLYRFGEALDQRVADGDGAIGTIGPSISAILVVRARDQGWRELVNQVRSGPSASGAGTATKALVGAGWRNAAEEVYMSYVRADIVVLERDTKGQSSQESLWPEGMAPVYPREPAR